MKFVQKYFPHILAVIVLGLIIWSGINPTDRQTWWAEIIPALVMFVIFTTTFHKFRFTNFSYFLFLLCFIFQTLGASYTFAQVPFEWYSNLFGFTRNNYDRIGHFVAGFVAFPIAELVTRTKYITRKSAIYLFSLFALISFASVYELVEWGYAKYFGGKQASDFLGSQGAIWDAQKDILMDTCGAIFSLFMFYFWGKKQKS
jgi:putative membrane protein